MILQSNYGPSTFWIIHWGVKIFFTPLDYLQADAWNVSSCHSYRKGKSLDFATVYKKKLTHIFTHFRAFQDWLQISQVGKILKYLHLKCFYQTTGRKSIQIFLSGKAGRTADWGMPQIHVPFMTISTTSPQRFPTSIFIFPLGLQIGKYEECKGRRMLSTLYATMC